MATKKRKKKVQKKGPARKELERSLKRRKAAKKRKYPSARVAQHKRKEKEKRKYGTTPLPLMGESEGSGCSGHCCKTFYLPFSPSELESAYHHWVKTHENPGLKVPIMKGEHVRGARDRSIIDIHLIFPMVRYLGAFEKSPVRLVVERDIPASMLPMHYYTCVHWNKRTKKCDIYSIRPQMCREYPYGGKCNYAACTWSEKKAKKQPKRSKKDMLDKDELLDKTTLLDKATQLLEG